MCWAFRSTPTPGSCWRRFHIRRYRFTKKGNWGEMATDHIDAYIDSVSKALGLQIEDSWRAAVRANLEVSLRLARLVDEFPLPDETEPASVFTA